VKRGAIALQSLLEHEAAHASPESDLRVGYDATRQCRHLRRQMPPRIGRLGKSCRDASGLVLEQRLQGYRAALTEAGAPFDPGLVFSRHDQSARWPPRDARSARSRAASDGGGLLQRHRCLRRFVRAG